MGQPGGAGRKRRFGMAPGVGVVVFIAAIFILSGLKVLNEYERAVVFRLGRLTPYRGPCVVFVIPVLERMARIELRTVTPDIPPQHVITNDNVTVQVTSPLYFSVLEPSRPATSVANYLCAPTQR